MNGSNGSRVTGSYTFRENGTFSYNVDERWPNGMHENYNGTGNWTLVNTHLTLDHRLAGAIYSGTARGDSRSFTLTRDTGYTLYFKR